jgi:glycosyltransferase involved in cell wall biosynthesis
MDYDLPKIDMPGVTVKYIDRHPIKMIRSLYFMWRIVQEIKLQPYDLIMIYYFNYCSILRLLFLRRRFLLDIRTSSIKRNPLKRFMWNCKLRAEVRLFRNVTVISDSLAKKLGLKSGKYHLFPLGAEEISSVPKTYDRFNLLYVGTLTCRNIDETIKGLSYFYREFSKQLEITFTIVGFGGKEEVDLVNETIRNSGLSGIVNYAGQVPYTQLKEYFDRSNVGISYIPLTNYFDCQPPTKTFEYIMSGLYCIATDTSENRKVINAENGLLCKDNPESFYHALKNLFENMEKLDDNTIRNSLDAYKWENIVNSNFRNYINKLLHV